MKNIEELREERAALLRGVADRRETAEAETRDLSEEETKECNEDLDKVEALDAKIADEERAHRHLKPVLEQRDAAPAQDAEQRFARPAGSTNEEAIYRPENRSASFFRDLVFATTDFSAAERLRRHEEETRDLSSTATAGGGFVPPVYLGDLWAGLPRQGRPFADLMPKFPLGDRGVNFSVPRITTGTAVAATTAENAAVNEQDIVEATITRALVTIAGQQDVSQQLLDRSEPGIDQIIFADLRADYDNKMDTALISGAGTSGDHLGIRAVTSVNTVAYTDASPTAAELVPKIYDAIQKVESNRHMPADTIVMHPRRAAWLASNLSSTFPLFQLGTLTQAAGTQDDGMLRSFSGLRVVLDSNIVTTRGAGTNEDEIYVLRAADMVFAEGDLRARVLPEVGSGTLTVRLQVYGYSAFIAGRYPSSITVISGTGLAAPTF